MFFRIDKQARLPQRESGSSGYDLFTNIKELTRIEVPTLLTTGIGINLEYVNTLYPNNIYAEIVTRSSNPKQKTFHGDEHGQGDYTILSGPFTINHGIIDEKFSGKEDEIKIWVIPLTTMPVFILPGQKIAQLIVKICLFPDQLSGQSEVEPSEHSRGGFGSTGY